MEGETPLRVSSYRISAAGVNPNARPAAEAAGRAFPAGNGPVIGGRGISRGPLPGYLLEYWAFTRPHDDSSAGVGHPAVMPGDGRQPEATGKSLPL